MKLPFTVPSSEFRVAGCVGEPGLRTRNPKPESRSAPAFTIIEIALCLGIIGFAIVAILGVLPLGLTVQKENRQETIINQDAAVWMDAIRNGSRGFDDLTNYVIAITNIVYQYTDRTNLVVNPEPDTNIFTALAWTINGAVQDPPLRLTNGYHIIGLLSTPTIWPPDSDNYASNYMVVAVRSMSGSLMDKHPQIHPQILDDTFTYRMIVENLPYVPFDANATCFECPGTNGLSSRQMAERTNYVWGVLSLRTNSHNLRLSFRWPFLPHGDVGIGRQTFRMFTGGQIHRTTSPYPSVPPVPLYFFDPGVYTNSVR